MLTLLNDRTYQVTVEKVENVKVGEQSRTIVTGWAVDKMRATRPSPRLPYHWL